MKKMQKKQSEDRKDEISITIRFPKELIVRIKTLAKKHLRSTNSEVIFLLNTAIEEAESKKEGKL